MERSGKQAPRHCLGHPRPAGADEFNLGRIGLAQWFGQEHRLGQVLRRKPRGGRLDAFIDGFRQRQPET
jgi:hypothetical protein